MSTSGDYWREHKQHAERESKQWTYCPRCDQKRFHVTQRRCFNRACAYEEKRPIAATKE